MGNLWPGQLTTVYLHQWVAAVDAALGLGHYGTLARQDILDLVGALGLCDVAWYDFSDTGSDAMHTAPIERLERLINSTIERARKTPGGTVLERRGEELRRRLGRVGTQREPVLVVVGVKSGQTTTKGLFL